MRRKDSLHQSGAGKNIDHPLFTGDRFPFSLYFPILVPPLSSSIIPFPCLFPSSNHVIVDFLPSQDVFPIQSFLFPKPQSNKSPFSLSGLPCPLPLPHDDVSPPNQGSTFYLFGVKVLRSQSWEQLRFIYLIRLFGFLCICGNLFLFLFHNQTPPALQKTLQPSEVTRARPKSVCLKTQKGLELLSFLFLIISDIIS